MKKFIISLFIGFMGYITVYSQATIVLNSGEKIPAKRYIIKLRSETISYKAMDGSTKEVKKADIFCLIRGKNLFAFDSKGFPKPGRILKDMPEMDPNNACSRAIVDAMKTYGPGGPGIGTGIVSFLAWPIGLITATVVSSTPPAEGSLKINEANISDTKYCECYKIEAVKKKKSATWLGWGLGTTLGCAVVMLITVSSM